MGGVFVGVVGQTPSIYINKKAIQSKANYPICQANKFERSAGQDRGPREGRGFQVKMFEEL